MIHLGNRKKLVSGVHSRWQWQRTPLLKQNQTSKCRLTSSFFLSDALWPLDGVIPIRGSSSSHNWLAFMSIIPGNAHTPRRMLYCSPRYLLIQSHWHILDKGHSSSMWSITDWNVTVYSWTVLPWKAKTIRKDISLSLIHLRSSHCFFIFLPLK